MSVGVMALVAALGFGFITAFGTSLGYSRIRPALLRWPARLRARLILLTLIGPFGIGLSLSVLSLVPSILALAWPGWDHCTSHDDHHVHLCFVHGPHLHASIWPILLLAFAIPVVRLGRITPRIVRGLHVLAMLRRRVRPSLVGDYDVVHSATPFAVTAGLLWPRIFLTTGLVKMLDDGTRAAVFAHEVAHVRRRDPLVKLVGLLAGTLHFSRVRQHLLDDLNFACEEACDEAAATAVGDRTMVAAALVTLGRWLEQAPELSAHVCARFGEGNLERRVHSLLAAPKLDPRLPSWHLVAVIGGLAAMTMMRPLHHVTESLLGHLFG